MWPTPTSRDYKDGSAESCKNVPVNCLLGRAVHIPTPTAGAAKSSGSRNTEESNAHPGVSLTDFVREDGGEGRAWRTPKGSPSGPDYARAGRPRSGGDDLATGVARVESSGQLAPDWVEGLMGFPKGFTDLSVDEVDELVDPSSWLDGTWEEGIPRVGRRIPERVSRLRALGNAVVPHCAAFVGSRILQWIEETEK